MKEAAENALKAYDDFCADGGTDNQWQDFTERMEALRAVLERAAPPQDRPCIFCGAKEAEPHKEACCLVPLLDALKTIASNKPTEQPQWRAECGGNVDNAEDNGYDLARWQFSTIAEEALRQFAECQPKAQDRDAVLLEWERVADKLATQLTHFTAEKSPPHHSGCISEAESALESYRALKRCAEPSKTEAQTQTDGMEHPFGYIADEAAPLGERTE